MMEGEDETARQRPCGCNGVRSCAVCEVTGVEKELHVRDHAGEHSTGPVLQFCVDCWRTFASSGENAHVETPVCADHATCDAILRGVRVFPEFISEDEEKSIADFIDSNPWKLSQSGRNKQDYGPRPNFKKRRVKIGGFCGLPPFSQALLARMRDASGDYGLRDYEPVEQCHLDYDPGRGSAIDPHRDDQWLWGGRLVTVNLLSDSVLTFTLEERDLDVLEEFGDVFGRCRAAVDSTSSVTGVRADARRDSHPPSVQRAGSGDVRSTRPSAATGTAESTAPDGAPERDVRGDHRATTGTATPPVASEAAATSPVVAAAASAVLDGATARQGVHGGEQAAGTTPLPAVAASTPAGSSPTVPAAATASPHRSSADETARHNHSARTGAVCTVRVPMPRRSLIVVEGDARHRWLHAVRRHHVVSRRVAVTYRDLGPEFCGRESLAEVGDRLRALAARFDGVQTA